MNPPFSDTASLRRVFVVEDHPVLRRAMVRYLEGHPELEICGEAETVAEAAEAIETADCHLVVCDLTLPDRDGIHLVRHLKAHHPELPIVVHTMHEDPFRLDRVREAGADEIVRKGNPDDLMASIHRLLPGLTPR